MPFDRKHIAKWGFGMAPISKRMRRRYDDAVQHLSDILTGNLDLHEVLPDLVSEAKGMMNSCMREDQWDWFTVFTELGSPPRRVLRQIASHLVRLRREVIYEAENAFAEIRRALISTNVLQFLHVYQNNLANQTYSEGAGWIYILSTRKQPDVLKIGRTDRSVLDRVREINSATGVLVPWAARRIYRVRNAKEAEREIHRRLVDYRIRMDREFFEIPITHAVQIIAAYLEEAEQRDRLTGDVKWFDQNRGFGFVSCDDYLDAFLHRTQLTREDQKRVEDGTPITFLLGRRPQGPCAINVRVSEANTDSQQGVPSEGKSRTPELLIMFQDAERDRFAGKGMKYKTLNKDSAADVASLFTSVFSSSEGESEGMLIGNLAWELSSNMDNEEIICYGAYEEESLIGSIFFTRLRFNDSILVYMLAPVAVSTEHQGKGVGQALINYGLDELKKRSVNVAITYGDPSFYKKVGFQALSENFIQAPLKLSMPAGWLGQSLTDEPIPTINERPTCVMEFNDPVYW